MECKGVVFAAVIPPVFLTGIGVGFVLGLNSTPPTFPIAVSQPFSVKCSDIDLKRGKCAGIDWTALDASLSDTLNTKQFSKNADRDCTPTIGKITSLGENGIIYTDQVITPCPSANKK